MPTYVIGDIQGCFKPFTCLLDQVGFDPSRDRMWSVGDLINRGHDNLSTLRWFYEHRRCTRVVLGNHDLHLLATRAGAGKMGGADNFHDILDAPDADTLLDWLQEQPLLFRESDDLFVHAGIPPQWSTEAALSYANEVHAVLRSERAGEFFNTMYGNEPWRWSGHLTGLARLRVITNYFTRMRYCTPSGGLDLKSKGPEPKHWELEGEQLAPSFQHPNTLQPGERVWFGHWASLEGKTDSAQFIGLDTGCVWGRSLTMMSLETGERFSCQC